MPAKLGAEAAGLRSPEVAGSEDNAGLSSSNGSVHCPTSPSEAETRGNHADLACATSDVRIMFL